LRIEIEDQSDSCFAHPFSRIELKMFLQTSCPAQAYINRLISKKPGFLYLPFD
jgi:hypothetical protein